MDSLTQIVLGAACGEAILGNKIGNKALLFGAIGGTIPDLDVFIGSWIHGNEIDAMLFHRGFMHSIFFSLFAALFLGWLVYKLYNSGKRRNTTTQKDWILMWFLALFTHPILDCFTPYGTQIFAPFSSNRIAFNNIAVVDPIYTLPFLICMIIVMFYNRQHKKRQFWLKIGVGISSIYMVFTLINKLYIDLVFEKSLAKSEINKVRYSVQPSIFNNILWYGIVETDESYFVANYSLFDTKKEFLNFKELPKQRDLPVNKFKDLENLSWFSNGYFSVYKLGDNKYQYNDLRYPLLDANDPNSSVFQLRLYKDNNRLNIEPFEAKYDRLDTVMRTMWERIKGISF